MKLTTRVKRDGLYFVVKGRHDGDSCTVNGVAVEDNFWNVLKTLLEA